MGRRMSVLMPRTPRSRSLAARRAGLSFQRGGTFAIACLTGLASCSSTQFVQSNTGSVLAQVLGIAILVCIVLLIL